MCKATMFVVAVVLSVLPAALLLTAQVHAQAGNARYFEMGNPQLMDIWVDSVNGNDANSGQTRDQALRTFTAAWNLVPQGVTLTATGYRIKLAAGVYTAADIPSYWASRYGTLRCPVIVQSADGLLPNAVGGNARIEAFLNIFDCRYLYLIDLNIVPPWDAAIHIERGNHTLLRNVVMNGQGRVPQALKVNQSSDLFIERCEIFGATGTCVDLVAVNDLRAIDNSIHDAGNWAMFVKGGSANCLIEGNEFYRALRGAFTAGQTTGFEFMESPWLHYEAYGVKFINNLIHDIDGSGLAVNGGYNILMAYNTLYRVGKDNHLLEIAYGQRTCTADTNRCAQYLAAGGWGTVSTDPKDIQPIPNRNVLIYNNVFYNPPGAASRTSHFLIYGPQMPSTTSNIAAPAALDRNLQIRGNVIWNGEADRELGIEPTSVGCQPTNSSCNEKQLRADNSINIFEPQMINPANGDYRPAPGNRLLDAQAFAIPEFGWNDAPSQPQVPAGILNNAVDRDRSNLTRQAGAGVGAYVIPLVAAVSAANYKSVVAVESLASAFGANLAPNISMATGSPLPTILSGTSVTVRDSAGAARLAPLFLVSPNQVNYLIPVGTALGAASISVENWNGSLAVGHLEIANVAPAIFTADASGRGLASAIVQRVRADGSQTYEPITKFDPAQNESVAVPIELGAATDQVFLVLSGTGFRNRTSLASVSASIGGIDGQILYAGPQPGFLGLDQINIRLSRNLIGRGEVNVVLTVDGQSANTVRINVK